MSFPLLTLNVQVLVGDERVDMETSDLSLRKMADMVGVALEQLQVTTVKYFLALSSQLFSSFAGERQRQDPRSAPQQSQTQQVRVQCGRRLPHHLQHGLRAACQVFLLHSLRQ